MVEAAYESSVLLAYNNNNKSTPNAQSRGNHYLAYEESIARAYAREQSHQDNSMEMEHDGDDATHSFMPSQVSHYIHPVHLTHRQHPAANADGQSQLLPWANDYY